MRCIEIRRACNENDDGKQRKRMDGWNEGKIEAQCDYCGIRVGLGDVDGCIICVCGCCGKGVIMPCIGGDGEGWCANAPWNPTPGVCIIVC